MGLIAPAILASGMLMADVTGFEATARGATNTAALHAQADSQAKADLARNTEPTDSRSRQEGPTAGVAIAAPDVVAPGAPPIVPVAEAVQSAVMEPTLMSAPPGPARLYGQLVVVRRPEETAAQPAVITRPGQASSAQPSDEPHEGLTCALDWKDTWLWDLCREDGGKAAEPAVEPPAEPADTPAKEPATKATTKATIEEPAKEPTKESAKTSATPAPGDSDKKSQTGS
ncbi:hypothetical protein Pth03_12420 [Planotetraspora thailandica]|uniref:Flp pilus-assembly TadG-like N-terminal domain-containing protein n=1 Tax=Planotetraspora thailandica TaxID=487172 RepID=A0A8J3UX41_9ACTN|nr:hypothetical protein Pth03_12420 [Planotetraspora thailandica]